MRIDAKRMRLYAVTDRAWAADEDALLRQVEDAIDGGAAIVQLREKRLRGEALLRLAGRFVALCRRKGALSIINDDVAVAAETGADGVHVGQDDLEAGRARAILGPEKLIGVSAHSVEEALRAQAAGADYLGCGAAFVSGTKTDARPIGRGVLRAITRAAEIPVVVIGGITRENLPELRGCGLDGVAVVSALFAQPDVRAAAAELLALVETVARPAGVRGAVFDLDGTLTDSMYLWDRVPGELVRRHGGRPPEDLAADLKEMDRREASAYMKARFRLDCAAEELMEDINALVTEEYRLRVPLKPGAERLLRRLSAQGVPCCIATASESFQARAAMERLGLWSCFEDVLSCREYGSKTKPDIYLAAARRLGTEPARTVVFEDALHAARTARAAGFRVCAVYDDSAAGDWDALRAMADWSVRDLDDWRP